MLLHAPNPGQALSRGQGVHCCHTLQREERLLKVSPSSVSGAVELICVSEQIQAWKWGWEHLRFLPSEVLGLHSLAGTGRGYSAI